ncbi:unnamed protein product [Sphagnum balticum]
MSDHSPLVMTIWGRSTAPHTTTPYFDTSLLKEEESKIALLRAWEGTDPTPSCDTDWPAWLEAATDRVTNRCASLAKEKKHAKGARTRALHQKIQLAKIQLQRNPEDETVINILSASQGNLADTLQDQVARNHQLSATSWFRYGNTYSKQFFNFHHIGRKRTLLKELAADAGTITEHTNLAHYVRSFYECLYASKAHTPGIAKAREECWSNTPTRISTEMNGELVRDLTLKEVLDTIAAIAAMPRGKVPRNDGIPTEFF